MEGAEDDVVLSYEDCAELGLNWARFTSLSTVDLLLRAWAASHQPSISERPSLIHNIREKGSSLAGFRSQGQVLPQDPIGPSILWDAQGCHVLNEVLVLLHFMK